MNMKVFFEKHFCFVFFYVCDSALLKTFGAAGMGVFPAAGWVHDELVARYQVTPIGPCEGVEEHFFGIAAQKKVLHPLVQELLRARH